MALKVGLTCTRRPVTTAMKHPEGENDISLSECVTKIDSSLARATMPFTGSSGGRGW